jgi:hypothetical protein
LVEFLLIEYVFESVHTGHELAVLGKGQQAALERLKGHVDLPKQVDGKTIVS